MAVDMVKVWRLETDETIKLLGGCGSSAMLQPYVEWIKGGEIGQRPKLTPAASLLEVRYLKHQKTIKVFQHEDCGLFESPQRVIGERSGAPFAYTAMKCGKITIEAVQIAKEIDVYSSGRIMANSLESPDPIIISD